MPKFIDLTGQTFGSWLVISRSESDKRYPEWHCKCTRCGKQKIVAGQNLRSGATTQCRDCGQNGGRYRPGTSIHQPGEVIAGRRLIEYRESGGKWVAQCLTCERISLVGASAVSMKKGCRFCVKRRQPGDYISGRQLAKYQPGDVVAGRRVIEYREADRKWEVQCIVCERVSLAGSETLSKNKGCRSCSQRERWLKKRGGS